MNNNKSIDGLKPRHAKKIAAKKPILKPATPKLSPKPTPKPTSKPAPKPTPTTEVTQDFLSPVQAFNFNEDNGELEATTTKKPDLKIKPRKEKKKPSKTRRIVTWVALIIVFVLIGLVTWAVLWGNDIIAKITGGQGNIFDLFTFIEPTYDPLKTDENGRTNILAFGTSGYNMEGENGDGTHDGAQLTDSIMMISLNQETGDFAMLSLPRDLKASPTCTATSKINEVYWCSNMYGDNEQAGAEALMAEVGSILGVNFQYYAHVNWSSVVQIVDILDGITVFIDENVLDYYGTGYSYYAGNSYDIDGEQALILSRARYGTAGGDFTRSNNQQKILIGIKERLKEKELSVGDLIGIASSLGDNLRTNFSVEELKTIAHLSADLNFNNMRQISLIEPYWLVKTGNINGISYVLPSAGVGNYGNIQSYVAEMISNDPRVYEHPTILILNGTETAFLASNEAEKLQEKGYTEVTADNAPEGEYRENITIYSNTSEKPGTKKMLEELYETEAQTEIPENISQDYDFVIIIGGAETNHDN